MGQLEVIQKTTRPILKSQLIKNFRSLGLKPGDHIILHSSLSSIGYCPGGARIVIEALQEVLTNQGTLVMPAHSTTLTDPSYWENPPIPKDWWESYRSEAPVFIKKATPCELVGIIPETFRQLDNVLRSNHPAHSFCAWGSLAAKVTDSHSLSFSMGKDSPLNQLYQLNGKVLLLGVGHESNTSMHLAESMIKGFPTEEQGAPIMECGQRVWKEFTEFQYDNDDFEEIGAAFESIFEVRTGLVGLASTKLFSMKSVVDYACKWIKENRN